MINSRSKTDWSAGAPPNSDSTHTPDLTISHPAMRVVVGWKGSDRKAASASEMGRFETELLTEKDNLEGLEGLNVEWVKRAVAKTVRKRVILDIDNSESPVHGSKKRQPTMYISNAFAIFPCSVSTSSEIAKRRF